MKKLNPINLIFSKNGVKLIFFCASFNNKKIIDLEN